MQFNVAQLLKEQIGGRRLYALEENLSDLDPGLVPATPLTGSLRLLRTHSGVLATMEGSVTLQLTCERCLEPIQQEVSFQFDENYRPLTDVETGRFLPPNEFKGQEEDLTDEALLINDQHILDISEIVRQNIWLAMPMVAGCIYGEPDRCPYYELRRQELDAAHNDLVEGGTDAGVDPRWAALLSLRDEGNP